MTQLEMPLARHVQVVLKIPCTFRTLRMVSKKSAARRLSLKKVAQKNVIPIPRSQSGTLVTGLV
jgi:hypothetical protein